MLIRILLILVISLSIIACKDEPPEFPKIKNQYLVFREGGKDYCIEYEIVSYDPYQIGNQKFLSPIACHLVSGFNYQDMKSLIEWKESMQKWTEEKLQSCR